MEAPKRPWTEKKSWDEFRKTGLFMFMNTILHAFGWAIAVEVDKKTKLVTSAFPVRCRFRGFSEDDQTEMHERIANYLAENAPSFPEDIKD